MELIKFSCYKCGTKLRMKSEYIGKKGRCPTCKSLNTVPDSEDSLVMSVSRILDEFNCSDSLPVNIEKEK